MKDRLGHGSNKRGIARVQIAGGPLGRSRGLFTKYDDRGLLMALKDPQLTGLHRRQATREATSRGLAATIVSHHSQRNQGVS